MSEHDCIPGCNGTPDRWSERTGHWYCAQGNDACPTTSPAASSEGSAS